MPHFMNNHANHPVFGARAISPVLVGSSIIKANHWVFHSARCFHADCHWILIGCAVFAVGFDGMRHHFGRIFTIQTIGFFCVVAHAIDTFSFYKFRHRIPNEFS